MKHLPASSTPKGCHTIRINANQRGTIGRKFRRGATTSVAIQAAGCFWCFSVSLTPPGNSTIQMHVPYVKEIPDIPISSGTKKTGSSSQHSTGGMKTCCKWPLYMPVIISKKICMNVASLSNRHLAMWQSNWMSPNNRAFRCHRFLWTVPAAFHPRSPHSSGHRPVL